MGGGHLYHGLPSCSPPCCPEVAAKAASRPVNFPWKSLPSPEPASTSPVGPRRGPKEPWHPLGSWPGSPCRACWCSVQQPAVGPSRFTLRCWLRLELHPRRRPAVSPSHSDGEDGGSAPRPGPEAGHSPSSSRLHTFAQVPRLPPHLSAEASGKPMSLPETSPFRARPTSSPLTCTAWGEDPGLGLSAPGRTLAGPVLFPRLSLGSCDGMNDE